MKMKTSHNINDTLTYTLKGAQLYAGTARCDITPPVGIYARMWGAAEHDKAEGVHKPITATVIIFRENPDAPPLLLIALDWVYVCGQKELELLRQPLLPMVDGDTARIIFACSHTHATGMMSLERSNLPGGELIKPYLEQTRDRIATAAERAIEQSIHTKSALTWSAGHCNLAANRDLPEPGASENEPREVCGFNPAGAANDTLLVGRITNDSNESIIATIVNYACHPTTLAWENKLLSPDYIGAMRELVEANTNSAPCAFIQGASGNLAPGYQYVKDATVADKHGRQLGFAVLSALESMLAPGEELVYDGVVESGAPLAIWKPRRTELSSVIKALELKVDLPLKPLPSMQELKEQLKTCEDRVRRERLTRKLALVQSLGNGKTTNISTWIWRVGQSLFVAFPGEPYPKYQQALRERFPNFAVIVSNVSNGASGYLYPKALATRDIYPVWQSPFAPTALDTLIEATASGLESLMDDV